MRVSGARALGASERKRAQIRAKGALKTSLLGEFCAVFAVMRLSVLNLSRLSPENLSDCLAAHNVVRGASYRGSFLRESRENLTRVRGKNENCASCGNKGAGVMLKADGDKGADGKRLLLWENVARAKRVTVEELFCFYLSFMVNLF